MEALEAEIVEEPRKKGKMKEKREDREGDLSRVSDEEARERVRRGQGRGRGGRGGFGDGWTLFGVHITAGVICGTVLLIGGLALLVVYGVMVSFMGGMAPVRAGRLLGAASAGILLGLFLLIRALVFGTEE